MILFFAAQTTNEAQETGIAAFGLDIKSFLFQLTTFVIVVIFLKIFVFNKFFKVIDERKAEIESGIKKAEESENLLKKTQEESIKILDKANNEASQIISDAKTESARLIKSIENDAAKKSEKIISDAQIVINSEIDKAQQKLKAENAVLVAELASELIGRNIDDKKDKILIEKALK